MSEPESNNVEPGSLEPNRLVEVFAQLKADGARTLIPFITAGYPDLETTVALLKDFEARGVRICELGIPFSDPIADGATIQASYTDALAGGITSDKIIASVSRYRSGGGAMALVAMVSYSIVYRHGVERYLTDLARAGFDGVIVPDLSLEESPAMEQAAERQGLANIMLIAPNTQPDRQIEIARRSRGFVYFMAVAGITGERDQLPAQTVRAVAELRTQTDTPVCIGFGISKPQQVAEACKAADGAIVGSAIVRRITDAKDQPLAQRVAGVGRFVADLLGPLQ